MKGRTAFASLGFDLHPFKRYSPFWFGSVESSLQQRIARRYSTGAGGKVTFHQREENEASLSLALLAERTVAPTESFTFAGAGGTEVQGFVVRPPAFDPSQRVTPPL